MITTSDFKKGTRFEFEGEPWQILDIAVQSPTARGGGTLVKTKCRNLLTGAFSAKTFKSGDKFQEPDLELKNGTYLYRDDEFFYFMDSESYEQYSLGDTEVGDQKNYLVDNMELRIQLYNGRPIGVDVPSTIVLTITDTEPAVRGDTVNAVTKGATLETGLVVQVPMFCERGQRIKVDTRDARYIQRAD
jgi:elongation factor P